MTDKELTKMVYAIMIAVCVIIILGAIFWFALFLDLLSGVIWLVGIISLCILIEARKKLAR